MKLLKVLLLAICFSFVTVAQADVIQGANRKREALKMGLYPPDIIMRHQKRLGITDVQRSKIAGAVKTFQSEVADLQWSMQSEQQLLRQAFAGYTINTEDSLKQAEKVLALESSFKLAHFRLLIAIKNALTEEQIDMINREIKRKRDAKGGPDVASLVRDRDNSSFAQSVF